MCIRDSHRGGCRELPKRARWRDTELHGSSMTMQTLPGGECLRGAVEPLRYCVSFPKLAMSAQPRHPVNGPRDAVQPGCWPAWSPTCTCEKRTGSSSNPLCRYYTLKYRPIHASAAHTTLFHQQLHASVKCAHPQPRLQPLAPPSGSRTTAKYI